MATVASRAGVSSALLHYHFETRDKLFAEVLEQSLRRLGIAGLDDAELLELPPPLRVATMIWSCLPSSPELRRDWLLWHELWGQAIRDAEHSGLAIELYREIDDWFAVAIRAGVESGDFVTVVDPYEVGRLALALCDGLGQRVISADPAVSLELALDLVSRQVGHLLGTQLPAPVQSTVAARQEG